MLINGANWRMDGLVQIVWWSVKRSTDDLMLIYIFLSIALLEGGKFIISTAKCCLFRLTELQPVECLFSINSWQKNSFFLPLPPAGALCSVWNWLLCYFSRSSMSSHKFWVATFSLKKTIQWSLHLIRIINRVHKWATCKENKTNTETSKMDLPIQQKPGYHEFCEMRIFWVVRLCCNRIF